MSQTKQLKRRDFLKVAGASVAAVTAAGLLDACTPAATPTVAPKAPAAPAAAQAASATATGAPAVVAWTGKTVTLAIQQFAHEALKPVIAAWEQKSGYKVALDTGPANGQEVVSKYAPGFRSNTSAVDVLSVDDVAGPAFARAGWLVPLDEVIPAETWADFPGSMLPPVDRDHFHSYEGKRYRVPHEFAVSYTWFRSDWFADRKVAVPKTWDDYVRVGKAFTSDPIWGTTEGMKVPGLTYVFLAYLTAQAGGDLFKFDDGTARAFQFCYDLIYAHKIMSDAVLNQDYTQQNDLYMKDRVAMMRQWPYFWGVATGNTDWYRDGRAAIALPPAGPAGSKTYYGGWGFSVPKFAPNLDAAKDLIAFVTNNKNAPVLARGQSWFVMPRRSILNAMGGDPFVLSMKDYIYADVVVPQPYHPRQLDAETAVDDVGQLFLTRRMSLAEAMKTGKDRIAALD